MHTIPDTMTAWAQESYGPASATHLATRDVPTPGSGEVLLRIRATALNAGDVRLMRGDPLLVRPFFGLTRPKHAVRGMDVAGTVVALGDGVTDAAVGDEVIVELPGGGGLAPYAIAPVKRLTPRPPTLDPESAACLPIAGGTAWQALDLAGIHDGGRVLIIGAGGGVGTFAVQLATLRGAEVDAIASDRHAQRLEGLGAVRVHDRHSTALGSLPQGTFDAVIDIAGGIPVRALQRLVRDGGTVVLVTGDGGHVLGPIPRMLRAALLSIGSRRRARSLAAAAKPDIVAQLADLAAAGRLDPSIERVWPFAEAGDALSHLDSGRAAGKAVVRPAE